MKRKLKMVKIDWAKVEQVCKIMGMTASEVSVQMGRSTAYLAQAKRQGGLTENCEALLCKILKREPGYFVLKESEEKTQVEAPKDNQKMVADLTEIKDMLKSISGDLHWLVAQEQARTWAQRQHKLNASK